MKFRKGKRDSAEINLAPLIDVVFILLLFFVVTTTFTRETQLKVDLPQAQSAQPPEAEPKMLEVLVSAQSQFSLNGKELIAHDLPTLMSALEKEANGDKNLPIVISADANAPHQAVVIAMDAAGKLGFEKLRITTIEAAQASE